MVQVKKSHGNTGIYSANRRFIKDLEPIIKKHGLENEDGCKEAIKMIKNNDPRGYHGLAIGLWTYEILILKKKRLCLLQPRMQWIMVLKKLSFVMAHSCFLELEKTRILKVGFLS